MPIVRVPFVAFTSKTENPRRRSWLLMIIEMHLEHCQFRFPRKLTFLHVAVISDKNPIIWPFGRFRAAHSPMRKPFCPRLQRCRWYTSLVTVIVLTRDRFSNYSQTCIKRPVKGRAKSGRWREWPLNRTEWDLVGLRPIMIHVIDYENWCLSTYLLVDLLRKQI